MIKMLIKIKSFEKKCADQNKGLIKKKYRYSPRGDTGHWREAGATSARAAVSVYTAIYRRRWGCETALQGARLRLSRAYLAAGGDARHARGAARTTFDPGDADHFAAAASPVLRGLPAGQRD